MDRAEGHRERGRSRRVPRRERVRIHLEIQPAAFAGRPAAAKEKLERGDDDDQREHRHLVAQREVWPTRGEEHESRGHPRQAATRMRHEACRPTRRARLSQCQAGGQGVIENKQPIEHGDHRRTTEDERRRMT